MTRHRIRGLEFPGGKVEKYETVEQAAIREVQEETGCSLQKIKEIGQYRISNISKDFVKSIFLAEVDEMDPAHKFLETEGIYFWDELTEEILSKSEFSFIMQDGIVLEILSYLKKNGL